MLGLSTAGKIEGKIEIEPTPHTITNGMCIYNIRVVLLMCL